MIGLTLGRYFFLRYIALTFWFFVGAAMIVFIVGFTEISGQIGGAIENAASAALTISALQTPMIMQQAVPFIGLVSGIVTLVALNRKYELVVARAAGISAWQFLTPICLGAFVYGLVTLFVLNPIASAGFERAQALEVEARSNGAAPTSQPATPWIKQRTDEGETIIGAQSALNQGWSSPAPPSYESATTAPSPSASTPRAPICATVTGRSCRRSAWSRAPRPFRSNRCRSRPISRPNTCWSGWCAPR